MDPNNQTAINNLNVNSFTTDANANTTTTTTSNDDNAWTPEEIPQLTVDVYRKENSIFVVSTVAGVGPEDIDINIEGNVLTIKGVRRKPYSEKDNMVLLEECFWGEFVRKLTINERLDVDKIQADLNQGILTVELPILKITHHKKIAVGGK
jgi:HSP20 family protein